MGYASFLAFSSTFLGLVSHRKEAASFRLDNLLQHPERNRPGDPSISHVTAILPSLLGRIRSIATHDKAELRPQLCTRPTIALHPAAQLEPCHCSRPCHPLTATCAVCCRGRSARTAYPAGHRRLRSHPARSAAALWRGRPFLQQSVTSLSRLPHRRRHPGGQRPGGRSGTEGARRARFSTASRPSTHSARRPIADGWTLNDERRCRP